MGFAFSSRPLSFYQNTGPLCYSPSCSLPPSDPFTGVLDISYASRVLKFVFFFFAATVTISSSTTHTAVQRNAHRHPSWVLASRSNPGRRRSFLVHVTPNALTPRDFLVDIQPSLLSVPFRWVGTDREDSVSIFVRRFNSESATLGIFCRDVCFNPREDSRFFVARPDTGRYAYLSLPTLRPRSPFDTRSIQFDQLTLLGWHSTRGSTRGTRLNSRRLSFVV